MGVKENPKRGRGLGVIGRVAVEGSSKEAAIAGGEGDVAVVEGRTLDCCF